MHLGGGIPSPQISGSRRLTHLMLHKFPTSFTVVKAVEQEPMIKAFSYPSGIVRRLFVSPDICYLL